MLFPLDRRFPACHQLVWDTPATSVFFLSQKQANFLYISSCPTWIFLRLSPLGSCLTFRNCSASIFHTGEEWHVFHKTFTGEKKKRPSRVVFLPVTVPAHCLIFNIAHLTSYSFHIYILHLFTISCPMPPGSRMSYS